MAITPLSPTITTTATTTATTTEPDYSTATATTPSTPHFSIKFGSPSSLSELRALIDVGTMTRLLHECIAYQRATEVNLESLLSHRFELDKQLFSFQKAAQILFIVRSDSDNILLYVQSTSLLADSISAKVRELDLAQSRMSTTLLRLDAISQKSAVIDAVKSALENDDYESAANEVKKFLEIDANFIDGSTFGAAQREELVGYKKQLKGIVRRKLTVAVDQWDYLNVVYFIRLFPLLGIEEEGLHVLCFDTVFFG